MNTLKWLESWFMQNCDGEWEHSNGIKVLTLDNPGWSIEIDLEGTDFEEKFFKDFRVENSDEDWIYCKVRDNKFLGYGGVNNLKDILDVFKKWVK
ncbi:immunity 53 family protein [[Brevibacterium] frigoritolerans]|uniref:immunity 53 family protein n=1 Tax=Peribacillus frigoritolerans TaxID=450367 RepID=UPI00207AB112|nr:immunity 53 family protein [Peribacillus frigoritolerans]MCK2003888.1 immunity 53 family protein [Peribacillus frigoritolerans]USK62606.1 immunity 53 family protein [Peribacillus frigoritolerans]